MAVLPWLVVVVEGERVDRGAPRADCDDVEARRRDCVVLSSGASRSDHAGPSAGHVVSDGAGVAVGGLPHVDLGGGGGASDRHSEGGCRRDEDQFDHVVTEGVGVVVGSDGTGARVEVGQGGVGLDLHLVGLQDGRGHCAVVDVGPDGQVVGAGDGGSHLVGEDALGGSGAQSVAESADVDVGGGRPRAVDVDEQVPDARVSGRDGVVEDQLN